MKDLKLNGDKIVTDLLEYLVASLIFSENVANANEDYNMVEYYKCKGEMKAYQDIIKYLHHNQHSSRWRGIKKG